MITEKKISDFFSVIRCQGWYLMLPHPQGDAGVRQDADAAPPLRGSLCQPGSTLCRIKTDSPPVPEFRCSGVPELRLSSEVCRETGPSHRNTLTADQESRPDVAASALHRGSVDKEVSRNRKRLSDLGSYSSDFDVYSGFCGCDM